MKLIHVFSLFITAESFYDGQFKYLSDHGYEIVVVSTDSENANHSLSKLTIADRLNSTSKKNVIGMELMLDAGLRKQLGKNGRKKVLEWYDFKVMWPLVGDLYKEILQ